MKIIKPFLLFSLFLLCSIASFAQHKFYLGLASGYDHDHVVVEFNGKNVLNDTITENKESITTRKIEINYSNDDLEDNKGITVYMNANHSIYFPLSMIPKDKKLILISFWKESGLISLSPVKEQASKIKSAVTRTF